MVPLVSGRHLGAEGLEASQVVANLIEVDLGNEGINYLEEHLRQGTGLCRKIRRLPLKSGQAFAPLPQHTSLDRAKLFEAGGLLSWRDTINWLADHVRTMWHDEPDGTLIFQDVWGGRPTDPVVQRKATQNFFHADNVYYFVESPEQPINSIVQETSSFLLIGVFVHFALRDRDLGPQRIAAKGLIDKLARSTEEIFVTAYDREGLVVWRQQFATSRS